MPAVRDTRASGMTPPDDQLPADGDPLPGGDAAPVPGASDGSPRSGGARKPFLLRIPPELMADLRAWANHDLRSLNGHIEYLLREAVRKRKGGA